MEVCSLPEILLLCDIKERVEVEHVEADFVQRLEQKGLGQLQLVKPIGNNYHLVRDLLYTESEKNLTGKATADWLCGTVWYSCVDKNVFLLCVDLYFPPHAICAVCKQMLREQVCNHPSKGRFTHRTGETHSIRTLINNHYLFVDLQHATGNERIGTVLF